VNLGFVLSDSLSEGGSLLGRFLASEEFSSAECFGIGIQLEESSEVAKRILLVHDILLDLDLVAQTGLDLL